METEGQKPQARPTLTTDRLILRPFDLGDAKRVQQLAGDPLIAATTATVPHPYLDGVAEKWIGQHESWFQKSLAATFAITLKTDGALVGCIDIVIDKTNCLGEIGYWVGVDYWNQGYCSEAMKAIIDFSFQYFNLNKITCRHMTINPASGRVMIKNGMKHEGTLRQDRFKNGIFLDVEVYGLLRSEHYR